MDLVVVIRIVQYLLVLVIVYYGFRLPFTLLEHLRDDELVRQYQEGYRAQDTIQQNAQYEDDPDAVTCRRCGSYNGENYAYCHNCLASLD